MSKLLFGLAATGKAGAGRWLVGILSMSHVCPCPQHPHPDPPHMAEPFPPRGLGTVLCRGSASLGWMQPLGPQLWDGVYNEMVFVGFQPWDSICCGVLSGGPQLWDVISATPHCGSFRLPCPLALSHVVSSSLACLHAPPLSTILWHCPGPFISAVAPLCQARFWQQQPQAWQDTDTHPGTPAS